jgi:AcrR family transcriptional regulator
MSVSYDMKKADSGQDPSVSRPYRMVARSEAAALTYQRIVAAAFELYSRHDFDDVSLDDVAARADVTVRTVLRRFGNKEALVDAVAQAGDEAIDDRRYSVPPGDIGAAVACVVDDYDRYGDAIMRLLSQEDRVPAFGRIADRGRRLHYDWVERAFAPQLSRRRGAARRRLRAELIAITDVHLWKLVRRDLRFGRAATVGVLREMVAGVTSQQLPEEQ